jgi:hypothetical protein
MLGVRSRFLVAVFSLFISYFCNEAIADPIGEIDTVGTTWCEEQAGCLNPGSRIVRDSTNGNIYIVWTYAPHDHYWVTGGGAHNCYSPDSGWAYGDSGQDMFPGIYYNRYYSMLLKGNIGNLEDLEILMAAPSTGQFTRRCFWNQDHFEAAQLDTIYSPHEIYPLSALTRNGTVEVLARGNQPSGNTGLYYSSYTLNPLEFTSWQCIDTVNTGYCIATSPVSNKSAISYFVQRDFSLPNTYGLTSDQDVYLISSTDGTNWDFGNKLNITDFAESDVFRPLYGSDLIIDYDNNAHIAFQTLEFRINRSTPESVKVSFNVCFIWHWSESADSFAVAADGWLRDAPSSGTYGTCSVVLNKPQLAINPSNGNIYMLYERYREEDISNMGYYNADQWVTVSTDNGLNWSTGINITDTYTPLCHMGDCSSEIQASLLDNVNDTLHITYILDKDAGVAQESEGNYTQNYVIYQKIPADLIPTTPLIAQFSFREGPPRCPYMIGDINGDSLANGSDVLYAVRFFKGGDQIPAISCDCPNVMSPLYGAGDVNGSCTFNGVDVTFYVGYLKGREPKLRFCYDCPPYIILVISGPDILAA